MRSIVFATAIFTAVLTSVVWIAALGFFRGQHQIPRPAANAQVRDASISPGTGKSVISKARIANSAPPLHQATPPAPTTRIGTVPDDLIAKRLTIPVQGIGSDQLRPDFYDDRGRRGHEAIDIMAPRGQPVLAVEDGKIVKLFTSARGGLTIYEFDPTEKYVYYYAHLDHYATGVAEGDHVTRGQIIGYVGSTGDADASAPHLHFAIFLLGPGKEWWKGDALDPYPALTR